jgi:hypothetical protein
MGERLGQRHCRGGGECLCVEESFHESGRTHLVELWLHDPHVITVTRTHCFDVEQVKEPEPAGEKMHHNVLWSALT